MRGRGCLIYDYRDKENSVSIWLGSCNSFEELDTYLSTVYIDDGVEEILSKLFLTCNQNRPFEQELRNAFDEHYNQFEYDFGLSFDDDFREASVLEEFSDNLDTLLNDFSAHDTFLDEVKRSTGNPLEQSHNAIVILYNFKYDGSITKIKHENINLHFIGTYGFSWESTT